MKYNYREASLLKINIFGNKETRMKTTVKVMLNKYWRHLIKVLKDKYLSIKSKNKDDNKWRSSLKF